MAKSVEEQVAEGNKKSVCFAIQLDESSDVSNRATLFCFVRYQEVDFDEELISVGVILSIWSALCSFASLLYLWLPLELPLVAQSCNDSI